MEIPEALLKAADLMLAHGMKDINQLVGCAELQIDDHWWVAINGHRAPTECSKGILVPPLHMCVLFNGWPAGFINPGGGLIAAGELANEASFIAAIENAMKGLAA